MLLTIIAFFFVFTIITLAHEFGHLVFAKRNGIAVPEFGLGFGPTLFSFTINETVYKLNSLPILGYVKIAGIDPEEKTEKPVPENLKFYNKSAWQKFVPIFAGAFMNLVLGFIVYSFIFMVAGVPIGLSNEIGAVSSGSEAKRIGLQAGDRILAINSKGYKDANEAVKFIHDNPGRQLTLTIERHGVKKDFAATPALNKKLKIGLIGFSLKANHQKVNPLAALYHGGAETLKLSLMILVLLGKLFTGGISLFDLAGPVGIAQVTGQYAQQGWVSFLNFIAFFSINVTVINLLPLPALDGGRLFFIIIEAIRRKPIDIELENKIHNVGMMLLLGLIAVLTVNDLLRLLRR
ncbi:RIP metalloprotease RseP [Candidatus Saganbacteria bacterium]|nr:RIP metalloprotease RseP [Candidatus Saganbacteria bacterium]